MHVSAAVDIRRELRPGDLGAIVSQHGRLYAREHGVDSSFEAFVGASVARAAGRGWPSAREGVWIVERDGAFAGSLGFSDEGGQVAVLRWFLLDPVLRGRGLGRRLVGELLAEAEANGFERIHLETFTDLRGAAHIYRSYGFEIVHAEVGPRWGREEITYQHYELELPSRGGPVAPDRAVAQTG